MNMSAYSLQAVMIYGIVTISPPKVSDVATATLSNVITYSFIPKIIDLI